jgi:hypothetical protein
VQSWTKEGVTVHEGQFAKVWSGVQTFFVELRGKGGLAAVAIDPLSSHECGNQRYLAIPWLDACLSARLPTRTGRPLRAMQGKNAWLATVNLDNGSATAPVPARNFSGDLSISSWLPNQAIAKAWQQYVTDTAVEDHTPPPAPHNLRVSGNELVWNAEADLESGLASFVIERDGKVLATLPENGKNPFGRPIFQNLSYSDTPTQPLVQMKFTDRTQEPGASHRYRVAAVNTVGLKSRFSDVAAAK